MELILAVRQGDRCFALTRQAAGGGRTAPVEVELAGLSSLHLLPRGRSQVKRYGETSCGERKRGEPAAGQTAGQAGVQGCSGASPCLPIPPL